MGLKTLWEKEKMLVTSIFSFSLNVFKSLFTPGCKSLDRVVKSMCKTVMSPFDLRILTENQAPTNECWHLHGLLVFFIPPQNECVWGHTGISLSVRPSLCQSVYKILVSVKVRPAQVAQW